MISKHQGHAMMCASALATAAAAALLPCMLQGTQRRLCIAQGACVYRTHRMDCLKLQIRRTFLSGKAMPRLRVRAPCAERARR